MAASGRCYPEQMLVFALALLANEAKNAEADVAFRFKAPINGVRAVRFTSLLDDGGATTYEDVAIAEILVE